MKIVSFEGIAGSGKTTISRLAKTHLEQKGLNTFLYRPISREKLARALGAFSGRKEKVWVARLPIVPPRVEALAYLTLLVKDSEDLAKQRLDLVLFDRYIDTISSGIAARNNMLGRKLDFEDFYNWFNKVCYQEIRMPDKTLVLDVDRRAAQKRITQREGKAFTKRDKALFDLMSEFYKFLSAREPKRFCFINANMNRYQVLQDALNEIEKIL